MRLARRAGTTERRVTRDAPQGMHVAAKPPSVSPSRHAQATTEQVVQCGTQPALVTAFTAIEKLSAAALEADVTYTGQPQASVIFP